MTTDRTTLPLLDMSAEAGCCAPLATEPMAPDQAATPARMFKALGDPVRLRLMSLLAASPKETCVCDLLAAFDLTGATISHHLKVLREAGLVGSQRRGTWVYYWPRHENLRWLSGLLSRPDPVSSPDRSQIDPAASRAADRFVPEAGRV